VRFLASRGAEKKTFKPYDCFKSNWRSDNNLLHKDFELYSKMTDAMSGTAPWEYCNYDADGVGFPRDCGPAGAVAGQWSTWDKGVPGGGRMNVRFMLLHECYCMNVTA